MSLPDDPNRIPRGALLKQMRPAAGEGELQTAARLRRATRAESEQAAKVAAAQEASKHHAKDCLCDGCYLVKANGWMR